MKEVLDILVWLGFIVILTMFIVGFNKQQIQKHEDKLDERQKKNNDKTIVD